MTYKNAQTGFTLIELLVVVLIIGILSSIAIPTFNGQRDKAKNSVAKSAIRKSQSALSLAFVNNNDSFAGIDFNMLSGVEQSLVQGQNPQTIKPGPDANPNAIYVFDYMGQTMRGTAAGIVICSVSKADTIFCMRQGVDANGSPRKPTYAKASGEGVGLNVQTFTMNDVTFNSNGWE